MERFLSGEEDEEQDSDERGLVHDLLEAGREKDRLEEVETEVGLLRVVSLSVLFLSPSFFSLRRPPLEVERSPFIGPDVLLLVPGQIPPFDNPAADSSPPSRVTLERYRKAQGAGGFARCACRRSPGSSVRRVQGNRWTYRDGGRRGEAEEVGRFVRSFPLFSLPRSLLELYSKWFDRSTFFNFILLADALRLVISASTNSTSPESAILNQADFLSSLSTLASAVNSSSENISAHTLGLARHSSRTEACVSSLPLVFQRRVLTSFFFRSLSLSLLASSLTHLQPFLSHLIQHTPTPLHPLLTRPPSVVKAEVKLNAIWEDAREVGKQWRFLGEKVKESEMGSIERLIKENPSVVRGGGATGGSARRVGR